MILMQKNDWSKGAGERRSPEKCLDRLIEAAPTEEGYINFRSLRKLNPLGAAGKKKKNAALGTGRAIRARHPGNKTRDFEITDKSD